MHNVTVANDTAPVAAPKITVWEIRAKDWKRGSAVHPGEVARGHHAEIVPGVSIRLFGLVDAGARYVWRDGKHVACEAHVYRKDFAIGDVAVCGGFNLTYTGRIRAITAKTVTVVEYEGTCNEKVHRFDIYRFDQLNWDFDAAEVERRNAAWMD